MMKIHVKMLEKDTDRKKGEEKEILVKTLTGKEIRLHVEKNDVIGDIKKKIDGQKGIPPEQQRLIFNGKQLKDNEVVSDFDITETHPVHMVMCLR